jgi:uncharacterized membrane protein YebE (DUF533 family)
MLALVSSIGAILPGLFGKVVGPTASRIIGFITIALLLGSILSLGKCAYDASVVNDYKAKQEAAAAGAREDAANQRVIDASTNAQSEEGLHNVIQAAPSGGTLSPAAHALACERLRRNGRVPESCRR